MALSAMAAGMPTRLVVAETKLLGFRAVPRGLGENHEAAQGYSTRVIIRWGDRVAAGAASFNPDELTAESQSKQFGYNNDFIAFMPLPASSGSSSRGLLCVNHEFPSAPLMWPGATEAKLSWAQTQVEMAAMGHSIVEIERSHGVWRRAKNSRYNRRITTSTTEMRLSGPAAGHPRLRTSADPRGTRVVGTLANCAGGTTPWGTILIAEENFQAFFGGSPRRNPEARAYQRYGLSTKPTFMSWPKYSRRFNLEEEPHEPNRFGWVVEIDPYNPNMMPVKRTALGRFKHEAATVARTADNRVVVYSGDDEVDEYVYRYVSLGRINPSNPLPHGDLLDNGILYVARFEDDGTLRWLPLLFGEGPLTRENGFEGQADVLIETRRAADLVGATPMDRPEDVEVDPRTGSVFVLLTGRAGTPRVQPSAANPRKRNPFGHIVELKPPRRNGIADHGADSFAWGIYLLAGDPGEDGDGARYPGSIGSDGWFINPDNCAFDGRGRMWIATDGPSEAVGFANGLYAADTVSREGPRRFFSAPRGAEVTGPALTPDLETLFLSVQHPGQNSEYDSPSTRWPDFRGPPRPSVVAITKDGGGIIGT